MEQRWKGALWHHFFFVRHACCEDVRIGDNEFEMAAMLCLFIDCCHT